MEGDKQLSRVTQHTDRRVLEKDTILNPSSSRKSSRALGDCLQQQFSLDKAGVFKVGHCLPCLGSHHRVVKENMDLIHGGETRLEDRPKKHPESALTANGHSAHRKRLSEVQNGNILNMWALAPQHHHF